jgi:hypothetical protein
MSSGNKFSLDLNSIFGTSQNKVTKEEEKAPEEGFFNPVNFRHRVVRCSTDECEKYFHLECVYKF